MPDEATASASPDEGKATDNVLEMPNLPNAASASASAAASWADSCGNPMASARDRVAGMFPWSASGQIDNCILSDGGFYLAHARLLQLCAFLTQLPRDISDEARQATRIGSLSVLQFSKANRGRAASADEWDQVDQKAQAIWRELTEPERRRFIAGQVPGWFNYLIVILLAIAVGAVIAAFMTQGKPLSTLVPFLAFVMSLGAIGASASIGMNALALQEGATFDLSSRKFLWLRMVLGALFGTLLTMPLGFDVFTEFLAGLAPGDATSPKPELNWDKVESAMWLLLPFVFGFSTSLVILVLTRLVEAAQTVFGKSPGKP